MEESLLKMKNYQTRYNSKFNKNVIFDGFINYEKISNGYVIWIRLIIYDCNKIIYDYSKEFILDNLIIKNKNYSKSLFMDKYELIDILDDLNINENNLIIIKNQDELNVKNNIHNLTNLN